MGPRIRPPPALAASTNRLRRMHTEFLDNLVYRLDPADHFKRDLGLKLTTKILEFLLSHRQLLFTAVYPLKGLPGNWDPLY